MKGLDRNAPSVPPQNSPQEAQQVEMWKKYIQWEKSNPLRTEDQTLITKRGDDKIRSQHISVPYTVILQYTHFNLKSRKYGGHKARLRKADVPETENLLYICIKGNWTRPHLV